MSNPNIVNVTTIYGQTALAALTTATANIVTNSASSNNVYKLNNVLLTNYSNATVTANVLMNRSATTYYVGGNVSIPAYSTLILIAKDTSVYMLEGDVLQANVSANSSVSVVASYEQIS